VDSNGLASPKNVFLPSSTVMSVTFFFKLNNYFINKTKKPVTKQASSKELISYTVSYTKVYKLRDSRWEKKQSKRKL